MGDKELQVLRTVCCSKATLTPSGCGTNCQGSCACVTECGGVMCVCHMNMRGPHLLKHQRPQLILQQLRVVRDLLGNKTGSAQQQQPPSAAHELEHQQITALGQ